jgi:hypothetical protein
MSITPNTTSLFEDIWELDDNKNNIINNPKQVNNNISDDNWDSVLDVYEEYKKPEIKTVSKTITPEPVKEPIKKKKKKKTIIKKPHIYDEYDDYY